MVVDGGSADATTAVVKAYSVGSSSCVTYDWRAQEALIGITRRAVDAATGEYCWLMSDDDMLRPGAVHAVLERLDQGFSLLVVNAEVRNADLTEMIDRWRLPFEHDRTYGPEELDRLLAEGWELPFFHRVRGDSQGPVVRAGEGVIHRQRVYSCRRDLPGAAAWACAGDCAAVDRDPLRKRPVGPAKLPHLDVSVAVADLVVFPHRGVGENERGGACAVAANEDAPALPRNGRLHAAGLSDDDPSGCRVVRDAGPRMGRGPSPGYACQCDGSGLLPVVPPVVKPRAGRHAIQPLLPLSVTDTCPAGRISRDRQDPSKEASR